MKTTLVEGFEPDSVTLTRMLKREGRRVTLAGIGAASQGALALRHEWIDVKGNAALDRDPGNHDEAFMDVWTPETAPRVQLLRERGCVVRCLGDLVLERSTVPTIGVTGTAGKTTAAAFLTYFLGNAGITVRASTTARAANLWPTVELLPPPTDGFVLMELTSSHLCYTTRSPNIAVITCFWPDHLELHGSFERYREAKSAIVRRQSAGDVVVVNEDDPGAAAIADLSPGRRYGFSVRDEVPLGAFVHKTNVVLRDEDGDKTFRVPRTLDGPRVQALLAAAAATLAAGAMPAQLQPPQAPPFRARRIGRMGATELIDDGMAATPAKTASTLDDHADGSVVLVAGGELEQAGLQVHASPEEELLLERACAEARRAARLVVLFGPAATRLAPFFDKAKTIRAASLDAAIRLASERAAGAEVLFVSPMFPLPLADRERIGPALAAIADRE